MKVLLVDDEESVRKSTERLIRSIDPQLTILTAANGVDALVMYRSESDIDLVITDNFMPNMNGIDLVRVIRKMNPEQRIIMVSGSEKTDEIRALHITFRAKNAVGDFGKFLELEIAHISDLESGG